MQIAADATGFEEHDENLKSAINKYIGYVKLTVTSNFYTSHLLIKSENPGNIDQ